MKNVTTRALVGGLAGAALALGAATIGATAANAASNWTPVSAAVSYTPDTVQRSDFRFTYGGAATTLTSLDFTLDAPSGVTFADYGIGVQTGPGGFIRVNEQYTSRPTFVKCAIEAPTQIHCSGPFVDLGGNPTGEVPINNGDTILIRTNILVPADASGPADSVFTSAGTVVTPLGTDTVPAGIVGTINLPNIVDTPVIAPALAGLALLGTAGIGGIAFGRRKNKQRV